ncbi:PTS sugar transporter subunit IIA [Clostridium gasigenes]|uniref:PTS system, N-acetylgalactosamine-specific IIA component n=1 Tax=Clostridium gasigenes TaxID=94869 RepID=A0A1H0VNN8_9CLOT|nr:hypothetical protein [Clostridium gasigenes]MBU3089603.1 hypothetical protein [Clostridium gasigenes]MBU3134247.1 hypothetical protein [Clostridium gasigenes]MBU3137845.1 hypothetical protein [Clostridium gasigenes]SDP79805.1 PTS system, N-acetylgalactosamine-specific IIA component [Clostridium gasigenes]
MKSIIIVSHGTIAKGIYQATNMIYGDINNVNYLCLEQTMGIDFFRQKLDQLIESVKDADQIVVLADLKGGSPYTSAVTLLSEKGLLQKSKIIAGLNLPMILSVLFIENEIGDKEIKEIINEAKEGIIEFEIPVEENENDDL